MAELIDKIRKALEEGFQTARENALNLKDIAEEKGKIARLKFEIHQLKTSRRKKMELLGETVYPFLLENRIDELKTHETLTVLLDEIKSLGNQVELTQKLVDEMSAKPDSEEAKKDRHELENQITEIEQELEERIDELKTVKKTRKKK